MGVVTGLPSLSRCAIAPAERAEPAETVCPNVSLEDLVDAVRSSRLYSKRQEWPICWSTLFSASWEDLKAVSDTDEFLLFDARRRRYLACGGPPEFGRLLSSLGSYLDRLAAEFPERSSGKWSSVQLQIHPLRVSVGVMSCGAGLLLGSYVPLALAAWAASEYLTWQAKAWIEARIDDGIEAERSVALRRSATLITQYTAACRGGRT